MRFTYSPHPTVSITTYGVITKHNRWWCVACGEYEKYYTRTLINALYQRQQDSFIKHKRRRKYNGRSMSR